MKKKYVIALVLGAMLFTACGKDKTPAADNTPAPETTKAVTVTDTPTPEAGTDNTPAQENNEGTPSESNTADVLDLEIDDLLNGAEDYLVARFGGYYDKADYSIPYMLLIDVEDTDLNDIRLYGFFELDNYNLNGGILECVSGGAFPGVMHASYKDGKLDFTGFDEVASGSGHEKSAKELFGDRYEIFSRLISDDNVKQAERHRSIEAYVEEHEIDASEYKDYGQDPVKIFQYD